MASHIGSQVRLYLSNPVKTTCRLSCKDTQDKNTTWLGAEYVLAEQKWLKDKGNAALSGIL